MKIPNSPAMMDVFLKIAAQRQVQREALRSGGDDINLGHPVPGDSRKLRRLTQSVGQVADAVEGKEDADNVHTREELRRSLLRLGADTVAWLEALEVKP